MLDRILVIDDEETILDILAEFLTRGGYKVHVAHDGEDGIELFKNGYTFDLVITDIRMPRMDGNAVARYIRNSDKSETPIVAMTGYTDGVIKKELFNFTLRKPFNLAALTDLIKTFH